MLGVIPPIVRRLGMILLGHLPHAAARFGPPIGVSSLGMFASGWGLPRTPLTLMATIGGTTTRPDLYDGQVENHVFLGRQAGAEGRSSARSPPVC